MSADHLCVLAPCGGRSLVFYSHQGKHVSRWWGDIVSPVAQHACRPSTSSGLEILVGFSADKTSGVMVHGSPHLAIAPAAHGLRNEVAPWRKSAHSTRLF